MAKRDHDNSTGSTVVVLGGGALLLLLLLRGKGWGLGHGDGVDDGSGASPALPACRVRVDSGGIQLDGAPTDLETTVSRCAAAGTAEVLVTGAAVHGVVERLLAALRAAGVVVKVATPYTAVRPEAVSR